VFKKICLQISQNAQVLDLLLDAVDKPKTQEECCQDLQKLSILHKAKDFVKSE